MLTLARADTATEGPRRGESALRAEGRAPTLWAAPSWLETALLSVLASIVLAAVAATLLAVAGVFSIWGVLAVLAGYCGAACGVRWWRGDALPRPALADMRGDALVVVLAGAVALLAAVVLLRPFEGVLLLQDPAVYLDAGIHISNTGDAEVEDELYYSLSPAAQDAFAFEDEAGDTSVSFRMRGFIADQGGERTVPQFFPLTPSWIAVFDALFGARGATYAVPLMGVLSTLFVFAVANRLFGPWAAAAAAGILLINAAHVWWGRNHASDMVYQFLLFGGLLAWCRYESTRRVEVAALAGAAFGAIALARIDAFLVLAPLAAFLGWHAFVRRWDRGLSALVAASAPLAALAAVVALTYARPYAEFQYHDVGDIGAWWLVAAAAVVATAAVIAAIAPAPLRPLGTAAVRAEARWIIAAAVVVAAMIGYFVRPLFAPEATAFPNEDLIASAGHDSLVRLGWYLTLPGLWAAVVGLAAMIVMRPSRPVALFVMLVLVPTAFYLQDPRVSADHIWASRRFIAATVPAAAIVIGFVLAEAAGLGRWRPRTDYARYVAAAGAYALALAVAVLMLRDSLPVIGHTEQDGAIEQVRDIARVLPADAVVIVGPTLGEQMLAPPLKVVHGRDTFSVFLDTPPEAVAELARAAGERGRPVFVLSLSDEPSSGPRPERFVLPPFRLEKEADIEIDTKMLELRFDGIPRDGVRLQLSGAIYRATFDPSLEDATATAPLD